jgi:hypothetical protein
MGAPYPASAYGTPGYGYAPAAQVKPLKGLATATSILLAVSALIGIFAVVALVHRASVVDDLQSSFNLPSFQDVKDADDQVKAAIAVFEFAALATGIVWIIWQFRFAKNAQALRGNYGLAPGWAIGGWFIPIAWWVLPQLQLFQSAKASDPDIPPGQPAASGRAPTIVTVWWVATTLAGVLFLISSSMRPDENSLDFDIERFARADRVGAFALLVAVLAAGVAIVMVRTVSDRQMRAAASAPAPYQPTYQQAYQPPPGQWQQPPPPPAQTWQPPPPNVPWQPPPPAPPPPPPPPAPPPPR